MRRGVGAQSDLFRAPVPSSGGLPRLLRGKAVELLERLLTEAITPDLERSEEARRQEVDHDHNHG